MNWNFLRPFRRNVNHKLEEILRELRQNHKDMLMTVKEYTDRVNAKFDAIVQAFASLQTSVAGVADDIAFLKETIEEIQNNPGTLSPADQALLDAAEARLNATAEQTTALAAALETLNAATQRPEPPAPA